MSQPGDRSNSVSWSSLSTIVLLFVLMRLTILFLFTPQGLFNAYSDYYFYFRSAQLSDQGYYPFINMWYEYPPMLAYLSLAIYRLTQAIIPVGDVYSFGYQLFARLLGLVFLVFETGVLVLLYKIALEIWGREKADWLGWVYSGLSLPVFFWLYAHQVVVVFFMMLAIFLFISKRLWPSAVALGLGVAAKFFPIVMILPIVKFLWPQLKKIVVFALLVLLVFGIGYLPFLYVGGGPWVIASFQALTNVGSYGTIWAVLDGNWGPGTYGPLSTRVDLDQSMLLYANPSRLPGWLVLAAFGLLYGVFFFRPVDRNNPVQFVWFSTLTWVIFHLYLRGWSPQWAVAFIPLILLSFPDHRGLILVLALTAVVFIEWPLSVLLETNALAVTVILGRTSLFIVTLILLARRLWLPPARTVSIYHEKNA